MEKAAVGWGAGALDQRRFPPALSAIASLFFAWGFVTAIVDPLIPAVRAAFRLTYSQALLTQFFFFAAYGLVSVPSGAVLARLGYWRATLIALGAMAVGCAIVWRGATGESYGVILAGLFVIASGTTLLQVAANPLASLVGAVDAAAARLNFVQAANSLGTVLGPLVGASLLLGGGLFAAAPQTGARAATLAAIGTQFAWIGAAFVALAACVGVGRSAFRLPLDGHITEERGSVLASPAARLGALAIFLDVGAEVTVSSILIDFLRHVLTIPAETAGRLLALYWGGLLVGRLASGALATRIAPARLLAFAAGARRFLRRSQR